MPELTADPLPSDFPGGRLRRFRPSDLVPFQAYRSSPELGRFQGWSVLCDAQAAEFLSEMGDRPLFTPNDWVQLAIADAQDNRLIGDIGLFLAADGLSGEIGFTLAQPAQGRGIGTAAVRAALHLFFSLTSAHSVLGISDARNMASVRLLQRAGFRHAHSREAIFRGEACVEAVYTVTRTAL